MPLVVKKHKKILINSRNPERLTTIIPTAKVIEYKGKPLVVVPHRPEEFKVLKNMGYDIPNPIRLYYDFPMARPEDKPFKAQYTTADFLSSNFRAYCLNDMGTGKTLSTLWSYDYLRQHALVKRMLVITPLSTMERTWGDEIFRNFPYLTFNVLHGSREKRLKLLTQDVDIYVINHDGLKVKGLLAALAKRDDIDLVVVDEIAAFRNSSTDRWKALNIIVNKQVPRKIWGLTGTPTPNEPTDAWAQCRLVTPETVPEYFGKFRDLVMRQYGPFKWVPRENALETVSNVMQPAIRFRRDECVDLPPVMYETRHAPLTAEQTKAYKEMLTKLAFECAEGQVLAVNEAVKASKLVQIACGAVYKGEGEPIYLPQGPRIEVLKEIVDEASSKVLVFVPYTSALEAVASALGHHLDVTSWTADKLKGHGRYGDKVAVVQGATSKQERDQIFYEFQKGSRLKVLVANPGTLSHGLTLTAANVIVWYGPTTSSEQYAQANARITRPGQKLNQFIIHLEGTEIERRMYERLKNKQSMQRILLDLLQGGG